MVVADEARALLSGRETAGPIEAKGRCGGHHWHPGHPAVKRPAPLKPGLDAEEAALPYLVIRP